MVHMNLLSDLLAIDPASPRLTVYNETNGSRLDFSAITLDNWAAKVANMLRDELELEEGATIAVELPSSWQAVAIVLGALAAGISVSFNPSEGDAFFTSATHNGEELRSYADSVGATGEIVLVTDDPMGRGVEETGQELSVGTIDFAPTVRFFGDQFMEPGRPIRDFATGSLADGARVLGTGWTTWDEFTEQIINPLSAGGSAVIVSGPVDVDRLNHIREVERVTH